MVTTKNRETTQYLLRKAKEEKERLRNTKNIKLNEIDNIKKRINYKSYKMNLDRTELCQKLGLCINKNE